MKSHLFPVILTVAILCLTACGGEGGSSSSSTSAGTISTSSSADTVTFGSAGDFTSSSTVAAIFEKVKFYLNPRNLQIFSHAYAVGGCSNSRIVTGNAGGTFATYDVIANNTDDQLSISDSQSSECVTALQDGANYVVFTTSNLQTTSGKCDLNLSRKRDGKHFCLNTDISSLIGASSPVAVSYDLGSLPVTFADDYVKEYFTNHGGFKSAFTLNGKYLFASFTATSNGQNYIGLTRFNLATNSKPTSTIVWFKPQSLVNSVGYASDTVDYYLRGFIALEYGDVIVDYISNYSTLTWQAPNNPPPPVATRYYVSVDTAVTNPANQKGFVLTYGRAGYGYSGWAVSGKLWDYLSGSGSNANTVTYTNAYNNFSVHPYDGNTELQGTIFINSNPASSEKAMYIKLITYNNALNGVMSGNSCDYIKVTVGSNVQTTPIQSISHLGHTYSCYTPSALVSGNLYSWNNFQNYHLIDSNNNMVEVLTDRGITAHPITGTASTQTTTIYAATPSTFTRSFLQSKDVFYVLDGFNGYFGGSNTGVNSIFATQLDSGGSPVTTQVNLGSIADGLYVASNASINPKTNQIQLSGPKKSSQNDYNNNVLWTAYVDRSGASKATLYPNINPPYAQSDSYAVPTKPLISLKNSDGTTPSYATQ